MRALIAAVFLWAAPALVADQLTGLMAFAECALDDKVTEEAHAQCAEDKDRDFQVIVFYNEADKKTYDLVDESEVEDYIGKRVVVDGRVEDGFLVIEAIKPAAAR